MQRVPRMIPRGLTVLAAVASSIATAAVPQAERGVLLALYDSTNGDDWGNHSGWGDPPGTECSWYGITCDDAGTHVTGIDLGVNNLAGTLPPLSGLTRLESLVAVNNLLTGLIPPLAGLTHLRFVQLNFNALAGSIPPLAGLGNLQFFGVDYNQLSGSIPSLAGLGNLESFEVTANQLSGRIPSLADLTSLSIFKVGDNQLSGNMPHAPTPNALFEGASQLCPNFLNPVPNAAWDAATGEMPWFQNCSPLPDPIYADGFDGP